MASVKVPDIWHPDWCFKQNPKTMERCVEPKGHDGKHTWEK